MSAQPRLDWDAPIVPIPIASSTSPQASHASYTGAKAVVETWAARQSAYLQVLRNAGAINDYEAQAILRWPQVSSVNSVRNALQDKALEDTGRPMFVSDGHDVHRFTDASGKERVTRRTRWRLACMELRPISVKAAMRIVRELHRHLPRVVGARHAVSAWQDGQLVGVALIGNPIARMEAKEWDIAEVTRVATDGTPNACSFLYIHAKRAAQALGYRRVRTKTLPSESGASLRAVGARQIGVTRAQSWDRGNRRRAQNSPVV